MEDEDIDIYVMIFKPSGQDSKFERFTITKDELYNKIQETILLVDQEYKGYTASIQYACKDLNAAAGKVVIKEGVVTYYQLFPFGDPTIFLLIHSDVLDRLRYSGLRQLIDDLQSFDGISKEENVDYSSKYYKTALSILLNKIIQYPEYFNAVACYLVRQCIDPLHITHLKIEDLEEINLLKQAAKREERLEWMAMIKEWTLRVIMTRNIAANLPGINKFISGHLQSNTRYTLEEQFRKLSDLHDRLTEEQGPKYSSLSVTAAWLKPSDHDNFQFLNRTSTPILIIKRRNKINSWPLGQITVSKTDNGKYIMVKEEGNMLMKVGVKRWRVINHSLDSIRELLQEEFDFEKEKIEYISLIPKPIKTIQGLNGILIESKHPSTEPILELFGQFNISPN